jgi:hypothetical protein
MHKLLNILYALIVIHLKHTATHLSQHQPGQHIVLAIANPNDTDHIGNIQGMFTSDHFCRILTRYYV